MSFSNHNSLFVISRLLNQRLLRQYHSCCSVAGVCFGVAFYLHVVVLIVISFVSGM